MPRSFPGPSSTTILIPCAQWWCGGRRSSPAIPTPASGGAHSPRSIFFLWSIVFPPRIRATRTSSCPPQPPSRRIPTLSRAAAWSCAARSSSRWGSRGATGTSWRRLPAGSDTVTSFRARPGRCSAGHSRAPGSTWRSWRRLEKWFSRFLPLDTASGSRASCAGTGNPASRHRPASSR